MPPFSAAAPPSRRPPRRRSGWLLALAIALAGGAATADVATDAASAWRGRYCTGPGCAGPARTGDPLANAAAFGGCALAAAWLSRRRTGRSR